MNAITDEEIEQLILDVKSLISLANKQNGELLYLQTLVLSLLRTIPSSAQSDILDRFDRSVEAVRQSALHSSADDEMMAAFDLLVAGTSRLRTTSKQ